MSWIEGYPNQGTPSTGFNFPAELERERKAMMDAQKQFEGMSHPDSKKGREKEAKKDEARKESADKIQALEKQLAEERSTAAEKQKELERELEAVKQIVEEKEKKLQETLAAMEAERKHQQEVSQLHALAVKKDALTKRSIGALVHSTSNAQTGIESKGPNKPIRMSAQFSPPNPTTPRVIVGFNLLDISNKANIRIKADVERVTTESVEVAVTSWADTVQNASGCMWMRIPEEDTDVQVGEFFTDDKHPATGTIQFARKYAAAPTVVVWLNSLDIDHKMNCRIRANATDVTPEGFTIHVAPWSNTRLYAARAGWIAFSSNRKDICAGVFSTEDLRPWNQPRHDNRSAIKFPTPFREKPKVFAALNLLDFDKGRDLRVKIGVDEEKATNEGFEWSVESWGDSKLYRGGASFIAFDNSSASV